MGTAIESDRPLFLSTREGIRLLGGAGIWDRCVVAGWIRPAVRGGHVNYYRYRDIIALAERLCHELPPRRAAPRSSDGLIGTGNPDDRFPELNNVNTRYEFGVG